MERSGKLLSSFDKLWQEFSLSWKKARAEASEKAIHDLRVITRRLISTLEISRVLSRNNEISRLQKQFKKVLKHTGRLRDLQVQLENISQLRQTDVLGDFGHTLKREEQREIEHTFDQLKRGTKRRLAEGFKDVRSEFARLHERLGDTRIHQSLERVIQTRRNEFVRAHRRFKPSDEETLHEMRIALKKLRYTVEAAHPVLGVRARKSAHEMKALQTLMGETRDVQLLRQDLEKWASKKGKKIAIVPVLEFLEETREGLMKKIVDSTNSFDSVVPDEKLRPALEKTAVGMPANTSNAALKAPVN